MTPGIRPSSEVCRPEANSTPQASHKFTPELLRRAPAASGSTEVDHGCEGQDGEAAGDVCRRGEARLSRASLPYSLNGLDLQLQIDAAHRVLALGHGAFSFRFLASDPQTVVDIPNAADRLRHVLSHALGLTVVHGAS